MSPFFTTFRKTIVGTNQLRVLLISSWLLLFSSASIAGYRASGGDTGTATPTELKFLAVPNASSADEEMKVLTAEPHVAGTAADYRTALYVAQKFRAAGLKTSIAEYRVWMNYPADISVTAFGPRGEIMHGPTPEHVAGDAYDDNPEVMPAFSGYSPSGDVNADVVYANYGRPEDFKALRELGVDVRGKIVIVRYGENFRGVKAYLAQEAGAAALIMYSDPADDGYSKGDTYPRGPWRPSTGVQRGTVEFGFEHPGDPTTPGYASTMNLPVSKRVSPADNPDMPKIPVTPLSAHDARPILAALRGPKCPRNWQGSLPFKYHMGPGPVRVHMVLKQNYGYRTIWDVMGKIEGTAYPDELVIAGNHRDAWVYGAVDPGSGTVAMLEAVRGMGELLKSGWRPKRTILFASWDAEEQGLIGSTEWVEDHEAQLGKAVAYFNTDTGAAGPNFRASATPLLKNFIRDIAMVVPSPRGGVLYDQWRSFGNMSAVAAGGSDVDLGNLGSGSDYTAFVDHLGIPSSDIRTNGDYGVYHSVFDNYEWYTEFGDPGFLYTLLISRMFGLQVLRMADADPLPYDYQHYATEIMQYSLAAQNHAREVFGEGAPDFTGVLRAARRFIAAGRLMRAQQRITTSPADIERMNNTLIQTQRELLLPNGLPKRPWFKNAIYAPADLKGYAASVIPGVNEAIENGDLALTTQQIGELAAAINRAAASLESYRPSEPELLRADKQ